MGDVVSLEMHRRARVAGGGAPSAGPAPPPARSAFLFDLADAGTYLAAERVERTLPGVEWVPVSRAALPGGGARPSPQEIEARAVALRLPLVWPPRPDAPRPAAMRAAAYASEQRRGAPFVLAASRLAFCGGFDLDDPEVLAEAAAAAGLSLDGCLAAARDRARDTELERGAIALGELGCDRLPAVRVGTKLFFGEGRMVEAMHAAHGAGGHRSARGA